MQSTGVEPGVSWDAIKDYTCTCFGVPLTHQYLASNPGFACCSAFRMVATPLHNFPHHTNLSLPPPPLITGTMCQIMRFGKACLLHVQPCRCKAGGRPVRGPGGAVRALLRLEGRPLGGGLHVAGLCHHAVDHLRRRTASRVCAVRDDRPVVTPPPPHAAGRGV